ncbi:MAG TPA: hypothetical protein VGB17_16480 [Pyrinomonadaceae bacterium]
MHRFEKRKLLGTNMRHVCDKCAFYFAADTRDRPKELLDIVKNINSLHENGVVGEEAYQDLIRLAISLYIQGTIENKITRKLDETLCEKLSPHNLLEALA